MATSTIRVVCECGKEFTVLDGPTTRSSIRCHLCGRMLDVTSRKEAIGKAQAEAEKIEAKRQRDRRIARAEEMNYAGLQFDGVYRTSSPINLEEGFGSMHFAFHFRRDLTVEYECRELLYEDGAETEVEEDSGTTDYEVLGDSMIRFWFDAGCWETEWEGPPSAEQLRLSFCMEFYCGEGPGGPKSVVEGEATLVFTPSANST